MENDNFDYLTFEGQNSPENYDLPYRLQEYSSSDLSDPNSVIEIIETLEEEANTTGKRQFHVRKQAFEGLDYLYEIFPEFKNSNQQTAAEDTTDQEYEEEPFETPEIEDRIEWLKKIYQSWSAKQTSADSQVEIVANPQGEGFSIKHLNEELGHVKQPPSSRDNSTSGIAVYPTSDDALQTIEHKGLKDTTLSENDKQDPVKVEAHSTVIRQLTIFDSINFINRTNLEEQKREGFSAKGLSILDSEKRWPKIDKDQELSGWKAMETALDMGFSPSEDDYSITHPDLKKPVKVKKAEFEYFSQIVQSAEKNPHQNDAKTPKNQSPNTQPEKSTESEEDTFIRLGKDHLPDLDLSKQDAIDTGRTVAMVNDGVLTKNDLNNFSDKLRSQYYERIKNQQEIEEQQVSKDPKREGFTAKSLNILDSEKRWPKIDKDQELSGWKAMETALDKGFSLSEDDYSITHPDLKKPVKVKKAEYQYFSQISENGLLTKQDTRSGRVNDTIQDEKAEKIAKMLIEPWRSPKDEEFACLLSKKGSTSESQTAAYDLKLEDYAKYRKEADRQIDTYGHLDDNLGDLFRLSPSKYSFEKNLASIVSLAKGPDGNVYELEIGEKTLLHIHNKNGSKETLEADNIASGIKLAIDLAEFKTIQPIEDKPKNQRQHFINDGFSPTDMLGPTVKPIHEMDFKEFLTEVHKVDSSTSGRSVDDQKELADLLQEWGSGIISAAKNKLPIPEENIKNFKGAVSRELIILQGDLPEILSDANQNTPKTEEWHQYGVKHLRGVGMGASPKDHVAYTAEDEKYMGGVVTYNHPLSQRDIEHYSYDYLGTVPPGSKTTLTKDNSALFIDDGFSGQKTNDYKPAFEMTKEEFREQMGDILMPPPHMANYVDAHYSINDRPKVDQLVKEGEFSSVSEYIHTQTVKEANQLRIEIPPEVLKDYPEIKPSLPEVWEVNTAQLLNNARGYQKNLELDDETFMKGLLSGQLHKTHVAKAIEDGMNVPNDVKSSYSELEDHTPRI